MRVKKTTISFERTIQIKDYEPLKLTVSEEIELEKDEWSDYETVKDIRKQKTKDLFDYIVKEEKKIRKHYKAD